MIRPLRNEGFLFPVFSLIPFAFVLIFFLFSCNDAPKHRFEFMPGSRTGVTFANSVFESDTFNVLSFEYIYTGGGVGVGDFNNDGYQDLFFTGNMVSSRLYINNGDFTFRDVTVQAALETNRWCTGVAVVDINQDGLLDIYVCTANTRKKDAVPNLLFLNKGLTNGVPIFEECASKVGLDDVSYSIQAAFMDFDLDGDLDVYLLTNYIEDYNRNLPLGQKHDGTGNSVDKIFRNDGIVNGLPRYTDVSRESGILSDGWGLGLAISDLNNDGLPDIYAANDFIANDHLYVNKGSGKFCNEIQHVLKHQEHNGMGMDIADINNDGLNDIVVMDMMPDDNLRQKTMFNNIPHDRFNIDLTKDYQPQYVRNVLQLNNGNGTFSDIGYLAGIYATDWSWSALLADFDNDGFRDLSVTNGFRKDITNLDFISYSKGAGMFGTSAEKERSAVKAISELGGVKKIEPVFRNSGRLTFENVSPAWGFLQEGYATGAAYADLDNDGDLDLITNNIDEACFIYQNVSERITPKSNFLKLKLNGPPGNRQGIGSKAWVYAKGKLLYAEQYLQRGYLSSIDPIIHFGLGAIDIIDSIRVEWPGGLSNVLAMIPANQVVVVAFQSAKQSSLTAKPFNNGYFTRSERDLGLTYKHSEHGFDDFKQGQALLLQKYSQQGPALAVGDINNDGYEDLVIGGPKDSSALVFLQRNDGSFDKKYLPEKRSEDCGMLLFDADNDNDLDLYAVSGSNEFRESDSLYQDRLYSNDGKGNFKTRDAALPYEQASGSCVAAHDFDKDGDLDLFVGGRILPGRYPTSPASYIFVNDGSGKFNDATKQIFKEGHNLGMITSALWTDFDNDGWKDLALVGEWTPIKFYRNVGGKSFQLVYAQHVGWWNSISGGDADNDGDTDYVLGNLGLNSLYKSSKEQPVRIYAKDFDKNGSLDAIVTRYIEGKEFPAHYRGVLLEQIPSLKKKLVTYSALGKSTITDLFGKNDLIDCEIHSADYFLSAYVENLGNGKFEVTPLPIQAQVAPLFGVKFSDVNNDNFLDIVGVGNSYSSEPLAGHYDAGIGICLIGSRANTFTAISPSASGFFNSKDAKALVELVRGVSSPLIISSANRDSLVVFEKKIQSRATVMPRPDDIFFQIEFKDGTVRKHELHIGGGYLSQSSNAIQVSDSVCRVTAFDRNGKGRLVYP